jgi:peptidoglycan biosynthesis protein MviN/MurJ (putative lipid II flippase)
LIERLIATSLGVGYASKLEYAARILAVPAVVFDGALAPALLADWSNGVAVHGTAPSHRAIRRAVVGGLGVALGCAAGVAWLAPDIVPALLGHGGLHSEELVEITALLQLFCAGFPATMGALLLERLFLAMSANRVLAVLGAARAVVRLVVVLGALRDYGLTSFALGYAVADWCYLMALVLVAPTLDRERMAQR